MQTANLINFIGALEKVEATPELIAKTITLFKAMIEMVKKLQLSSRHCQ